MEHWVKFSRSLKVPEGYIGKKYWFISISYRTIDLQKGHPRVLDPSREDSVIKDKNFCWKYERRRQIIFALRGVFREKHKNICYLRQFFYKTVDGENDWLITFRKKLSSKNWANELKDKESEGMRGHASEKRGKDRRKKRLIFCEMHCSFMQLAGVIKTSESE